MPPTRVILDCDTANEIDDQFAIAHALGMPEALDVRGVVSVHNTTAHGPGSRDMYQEEAERVVALCGADVPCIPGAERPMEHREDLAPSAGLEFLVEEARRGPLTILATGPATDVASLLLAAPETRENLRVVWLGGFGDRESYQQYRMGGELNGRADIAAWRALFERDLDLLHVPCWPGPVKLVVDESYPKELRALDRPISDYLADILALSLSEHGGEVHEGRGKVLWDLACVAAVADPDSVTVGRLAVPTLDAAGAHDFSQRGREVDAMTNLDPERVLAGMMKALKHHPADV